MLLFFLLLLLPELLNPLQLFLNTGGLNSHHILDLMSLHWTCLLNLNRQLKLDLLRHSTLLGLYLSHNMGLKLGEYLDLLLKLRYGNHLCLGWLNLQWRAWSLHGNLIYIWGDWQSLN